MRLVFRLPEIVLRLVLANEERNFRHLRRLYERQRKGYGHLPTVGQLGASLEVERCKGRKISRGEAKKIGSSIITCEDHHRKAVAFAHSQPIVITEAEEWRRRREVMPRQTFWPINFQQLDEVPSTELG